MTEETTLSFEHVFVPPTDAAEARTVLLLHGTGGNERDLLQLGGMIAPGAGLLGVRGQVLENGMPRFFRRLAEGVFDEADVVRRAGELAAFARDAAGVYGFDPASMVALGYSNGANIAAAMMLLHPTVLSGGMLLRAMVPLEHTERASLSGVRVLLAEGAFDPIIPPENGSRLASMLTNAGATVRLHWEQAAHGLTQGDVAIARDWFAGA